MYISIKVGLFKVIPLVIPEVFCLSMGSPPHGLVGSTGRGTWKRAFKLYLYLFFRTFECISFGAYISLSQIELSVYNLDIR